MFKTIEPLPQIEKQLLHYVAEQAGEWRAGLRSQIESAGDVTRTITAVGEYIDFHTVTAEHLQEGSPERFMATVLRPDQREAVDVILYMKNGKLALLEIVTTGENIDLSQVHEWLTSPHPPISDV